MPAADLIQPTLQAKFLLDLLFCSIYIICPTMNYLFFPPHHSWITLIDQHTLDTCVITQQHPASRMQTLSAHNSGFRDIRRLFFAVVVDNRCTSALCDVIM